MVYQYTDIVLSHQTGNALNYLYLDAAWLGYPVLHNSDMMKNIGFYYLKNDVDSAVEQLANIIENFDKTHEEYLKKSLEMFEKIKDTYDSSSTLTTYGVYAETCLRNKDYANANAYNEKAMAINEAYKFNDRWGIPYISKGMILQNQNKHYDAIEYFKKSIITSDKLDLVDLNNLNNLNNLAKMVINNFLEYLKILKENNKLSNDFMKLIILNINQTIKKRTK